LLVVLLNEKNKFKKNKILISNQRYYGSYTTQLIIVFSIFIFIIRLYDRWTSEQKNSAAKNLAALF